MKEAQHRLQAAFERTHWWHRGKRRILRHLVEALVPPGVGRRVLEVGCGVGENLGHLSGHYLCTGLDISEEALGWARAHFPHIQFRQGDSPRCFENDLYQADAILLLDVLEHIDDDRGFLSEVVRCARPGSYLFVTVPAAPSLWGIHDESLGHRRRYTEKMMRVLWTHQPVTPLLVTHYNARLYPLAWVTRTVSKVLARPWGGAGTDVGPLPAWLGDALAWIFGGEAGDLLRALKTGKPAYHRGLSLFVILRRETGS